MNCRWWRFNDSDVSPLELSELGQELEELKEPTQTKISRAKTRKTPSTDTAFSGNHMLSSTNAYMLIYHRRGLDLPQPAEVKADLMAQVEAKNEALKQSQEQYQNLVNVRRPFWAPLLHMLCCIVLTHKML
eukprot:SAG31_NODE_296_length_18227_cov_39.663173_7_plen_131_part_00